mgnify:CR=1 FL=1
MGLDYVISKIGKYWDDRSYTFDSEHDTENEEIWKSFILSILGDDKNKSVIDIGTGTGFLANMTAELGYNSIGMDISKGMMDYAVRHAREKGLNNVIEVYLDTAPALPSLKFRLHNAKPEQEEDFLAAVKAGLKEAHENGVSDDLFQIGRAHV